MDMTQLLERAIAEIHKLPAQRQDAVASLILDELADDRRWDEAFARSQDELAKLAGEVRADTASGRVRDIGIDEL